VKLRLPALLATVEVHLTCFVVQVVVPPTMRGATASVPSGQGLQTPRASTYSLTRQYKAVHPDRVKSPAEAQAETTAVPEKPAAHAAVTANVGTSSDVVVVMV